MSTQIPMTGPIGVIYLLQYSEDPQTMLLGREIDVNAGPQGYLLLSRIPIEFLFASYQAPKPPSLVDNKQSFPFLPLQVTISLISYADPRAQLNGKEKRYCRDLSRCICRQQYAVLFLLFCTTLYFMVQYMKELYCNVIPVQKVMVVDIIQVY